MTTIDTIIGKLSRLTEADFRYSVMSREFDTSTSELQIHRWVRQTEEDLVMTAVRLGRTPVTAPEVLKESGGGGSVVRVRLLTMPLIRS